MQNVGRYFYAKLFSLSLTSVFQTDRNQACNLFPVLFVGVAEKANKSIGGIPK